MEPRRKSLTGAGGLSRTKPAAGVIDCDIHHACAAKSDLFPYLSRLEARRLDDYGLGPIEDFLALGAGDGGCRADFVSSAAKAALGIGFDHPDPLSDYLNQEAVEAAVLIGATTLTQSATVDRAFATSLCRAFNDYTADRWLLADRRFHHAISIPQQEPQEAVAEIRRWEGNPQVVGVVLPCGATRPFGHRFYTPILAACAEAGLAVIVHWGGEGLGLNPAPTPAGYLTYLAEIRLARSFAYQVHLSSLVLEGVLERMPQLRIVVCGSGLGWLPGYLAQLDGEWQLLQSATPWVTSPPTSYLRRQVRFAVPSLAGLDSGLDPKLDGIVMFGSHLPHWDARCPSEETAGSQALQRAWQHENAASFLALTEVVAP